MVIDGLTSLYRARVWLVTAGTVLAAKLDSANRKLRRNLKIRPKIVGMGIDIQEWHQRSC